MSENPEIELQDANENPWYVLATVFGEQEGGEVDYDLARKNRSVWNAWALSEHSSEETQAFYDGLPAHFDRKCIDDVEDMPDWMEHVQAAFAERFGQNGPPPTVPSPSDRTIRFTELVFRKTVEMSGYIFPTTTSFSDSRAQRIILVSGAVFCSSIFFDRFHAEQVVCFDDCVFNDCFSLYGIGNIWALLLRRALFTSAPPSFSEGASIGTLHVTAGQNHWPLVTRETVHIGIKTDYITLRRMMADRQDTDMEHFFYRQEMRCIIAENGDNLWKRLPYQFFGWFSDFGHSIARPVQWLGVIWYCLSSLYFAAFTYGANPTDHGVDTYVEHAELYFFSLGHSAANMFAFLGFRGLYFENQIKLMSGWVQVLSATQTMASFALLFFLALALRNRFRLQ